MIINRESIADPLIDVRWAIVERGTLLFGENATSFARRLAPALTTSNGFDFKILYPSEASIQYDDVKSSDILEIIGKQCVSCFYAISERANFALYSSYRDDLTVLNIGCGDWDALTPRIDASFSRHIKRGGVGFGSEGQAYILNLLARSVDAERLRGIL